MCLAASVLLNGFILQAGLTGGLDKLEIYLPATVPFKRDIAEIHAAARAGAMKGFHRSQLYNVVGDLRPFGREAILHANHRFDGSGKLELLGVGDWGLSDVLSTVESVVDTDPAALRTMRADLTADVDNVPVRVFLERCRVQYKRFVSGVEHLEGQKLQWMGRGDIESLYGGKRPNFFRIYNKTAERKNVYSKMVRGWEKKHAHLPDMSTYLANSGEYKVAGEWRPGASETDYYEFLSWWMAASYLKKQCQMGQDAPSLPKPTFEQTFGFPESRVWTRVERAMSAKEVTKLGKFETVGRLKAALPEFNPFKPLVFLRPGRPEPNPEDYPARLYGFGMWYRMKVEHDGAAVARAWLNRYDSNPTKTLQAIADFLPAPAGGSADVVSIDSAALFDRYRAAVERQLAA